MDFFITVSITASMLFNSSPVAKLYTALLSQSTEIFPKTSGQAINLPHHQTINLPHHQTINLPHHEVITSSGLPDELKSDCSENLTTKPHFDIHEHLKMIMIPSGYFRMGDLNDQGHNWEKPVHTVYVYAFEMSETEITFALWDACVEMKACSYQPSDEGWGRDQRPVINVSFNDITNEFLPWLHQLTGKKYRLPSESEWEYAARAESISLFSWGNNIGMLHANCDGCGSHWDNKSTAPVKSFGPNGYGLYDMHGNVWEWTQACWNDSYENAPSTTENPWVSGTCERHVLRGGSWFNEPSELRSANRYGDGAESRDFSAGFRVVLQEEVTIK